MYPKTAFSTDQVLKLILNNPKIKTINQDIRRSEGYLKSVKKDRLLRRRN